MAQHRSAVTARPHAGQADLPLLLDFASRALRTRFPLEALWHPGDLVWQLKDAGDAHLNMRLWEDASGIVATALFAGPRQLWFECLPGYDDRLLSEILAWAEEGVDAEALSVKLAPRDEARARAVEALGYRRGEAEGVRFRRALDQEITSAPVPAGIRLRDSVDVDPEARAACHRDAWNHLDHLGSRPSRASPSGPTGACWPRRSMTPASTSWRRRRTGGWWPTASAGRTPRAALEPSSRSARTWTSADRAWRGR
jgi:hypothetical protein